MSQLDAFTRAYLECALWSSTDNDPEGAETERRPLDEHFGIDDMAPETLGLAMADCDDFRDHCAQIGLAEGLASLDEAAAGYDFWLTRNGHGAGFWDRGLGALGEDLSSAAKTFGWCELYVGDDGKVYMS